LLLKWILYVLFVIVVLRLARRLLRRADDARRAGRKGLDPERAVRASWSEVRDEEGKGSGDR
jgi:hypothetical protein